MKIYAYYTAEDVLEIFARAIDVPIETVKLTESGAEIHLEGKGQPLNVGGQRVYTRRERKAEKEEKTENYPQTFQTRNPRDTEQPPRTFAERQQEPLRTLRARARKFSLKGGNSHENNADAESNRG